jgi:hypothetical protein
MSSYFRCKKKENRFNPNNGELQSGSSRLEEVQLEIQKLVSMCICHENDMVTSYSVFFDNNGKIIFGSYCSFEGEGFQYEESGHTCPMEIDNISFVKADFDSICYKYYLCLSFKSNIDSLFKKATGDIKIESKFENKFMIVSDSELHIYNLKELFEELLSLNAIKN